jgi:hypothetical protein
MKNKDMELWKDLQDNNPNNIEDLKNMMLAVGYTKGEIGKLLNLKKVNGQKTKLDQLKEDIYIRYKLKQRMLFEHVQHDNIISTFTSMRDEDRHVIDSLTKLGDIAPTGSVGGGGDQMPLRLETFVYKAAQEESAKAADPTSHPLPQLQDVTEEEE